MPKCRILPVGVSAWKSPAPVVGEQGPVRRPEVGRAAEKPRDVLREDVQHLAGGVASGDALCVRREHREIAIPSGGKFAALHLVDLGGELGEGPAIAIEELHPFAPGRRAARADSLREVLIDAVGHQELCVFRPAVAAFGEADFLFAERLAVSLGGVLFVGRPVADVAVQNDQGGPAFRLPENARERARCDRYRWHRPTRRTFHP